MDPIQVLWSPAGASMPNLGARALVDVSDGDTPNIRVPIRMLSVDTPEVTAKSPAGAAKVDAKLLELAGWLREGKAPVTRRLRDHLLPRLESGLAGTAQLAAGREASAFMKAQVEARLKRPNGTLRNLFIRTGDAPFDNYHRLLAYIAPNYSTTELATLSREQRSTFNLDLVASGWATPFVVYPNIPGELDLPIFVRSAVEAMDNRLGIWADELVLHAYEYRMCEKLHAVTKKIVAGTSVTSAQRYGWRSRYVADMRDRRLHGPEAYIVVPPAYSIWIWPADVQRAIGALNLTPAPDLVT